jgi:hypothetical protein
VNRAKGKPIKESATDKIWRAYLESTEQNETYFFFRSQGYWCVLEKKMWPITAALLEAWNPA